MAQNVSINFRAGTIDLESESDIEKMFPSVLKLIEDIDITKFSARGSGAESGQDGAAAEESEAKGEDESSDGREQGGNKTVRARSQRPGKSNLSPAKIDLTADQHRTLKDLVAAKQPRTQNDQVLTVMHWAKESGVLPKCDASQTLGLLRHVGLKLPKNILAVMGNLKNDGLINSDGKGVWSIHYNGEEYVTHDLPRQNKD